MATTCRCPACRTAVPSPVPRECPSCGADLLAALRNAARAVRRRTEIPVAAPFAPPPAPKHRTRLPADKPRARPPWVLLAVCATLAGFFVLAVMLVIFCFSAGGGTPSPADTEHFAEGPAPAPAQRDQTEAPPKRPPVTPKQPEEKGPSDEMKGEAEDAHHDGHRLDTTKPLVGPKPSPMPEKIEEKKPDPPPPPLIDPPKKKEVPLFPDVPVVRPVDFKILHPVTTARTTKVKSLRLAVTPARYDDMGKLLDGLGEGYKHVNIGTADLNNVKKLAEFDVLFLTCAPSSYQDLRLATVLRHYVERGGTLYASDLRFDVLARAFPEYADRNQFNRRGVGSQTVIARVVNPGLREVLGDKIHLNLNAGGWRPAGFLKHKVTTYLEGTYRTRETSFKGPLMVKFSHGKGAVIFTSFHNAAQNTELESKLLHYLVFTAVTVQVETEVRQSMLSVGFTPLDARRLSASAGETTEPHTYSHAKAGPLQLALGFEAREGVKLRLTLQAPNGQKIQHEDSKTFTVEVLDAPAGEWRYAVTALEVPFANYPLTLTVGKK